MIFTESSFAVLFTPLSNPEHARSVRVRATSHIAAWSNRQIVNFDKKLMGSLGRDALTLSEVDKYLSLSIPCR